MEVQWSPSYKVPPTKRHPSYRAIFAEKDGLIRRVLQSMHIKTSRGHLIMRPLFSLQKGWPDKRGTIPTH